MTDQPRLTDAARAALENVGNQQTVSPWDDPQPHLRNAADYQQGWRDCYAHLVGLFLGHNEPPR